MKKLIAIFKNGFGVRVFYTYKPEAVFLKPNEIMIIDPDLTNVGGASPSRWKLTEENNIVLRALGEN
jgi:hypothetical protein